MLNCKELVKIKQAAQVMKTLWGRPRSMDRLCREFRSPKSFSSHPSRAFPPLKVMEDMLEECSLLPYVALGSKQGGNTLSNKKRWERGFLPRAGFWWYCREEGGSLSINADVGKQLCI